MTLSALPAVISAGTSVEYLRELGGYTPSAGWTYQLAMRIPGYTPKTAVADGAGFRLTLTADDTAAWPAGTYHYSERVILGDRCVEVGSGTVTVRPNLALAGTGAAADGRSHAQRALAIIEAALEGRLADGIQNYSIAGRAVSKIPLPELVKLRDYYRIQVARERNGGRFGSVQIVFGG